MTGKVSKRKAKRACIDCHFLMRIPQLDCGIPPIIGENDNGPVYHDMKNTIVNSNTRDIILNYSGLLCFTYFLGCYHEFWIQTDDCDNNISKGGKLYEVIVETDRSDCVFFFEYHPSMSFEAAEKIQDRMAVLGAHDQSNKTETVAYKWSINNTRAVFCNGQPIAKLPNLQFKLFKCLYKEHGKYVKNKKLEKCWGDNTVRYSKSLPDTMSKIRTKLKKGLMKNKIQVKDKVIEPKQVKKQNVAYKLVT